MDDEPLLKSVAEEEKQTGSESAANEINAVDESRRDDRSEPDDTNVRPRLQIVNATLAKRIVKRSLRDDDDDVTADVTTDDVAMVVMLTDEQLANVDALNRAESIRVVARLVIRANVTQHNSSRRANSSSSAHSRPKRKASGTTVEPPTWNIDVLTKDEQWAVDEFDPNVQVSLHNNYT